MRNRSLPLMRPQPIAQLVLPPTLIQPCGACEDRACFKLVRSASWPGRRSCQHMGEGTPQGLCLVLFPPTSTSLPVPLPLVSHTCRMHPGSLLRCMPVPVLHRHCHEASDNSKNPNLLSVPNPLLALPPPSSQMRDDTLSCSYRPSCSLGCPLLFPDWTAASGLALPTLNPEPTSPVVSVQAREEGAPPVGGYNGSQNRPLYRRSGRSSSPGVC